MKRKARFGGQTEPQNLKRFKTELNRFNKDHGTDWASIQGTGDARTFQKSGYTQSRKVKRKEARKLKKMRISAFKQNKPIPTKESLEAEKKQVRKAERAEKLKEKRKKQKKEKKKKQKEKKEEEVDVRSQGLLQANKEEDRTIKQLEKQLKLNKRKNKSTLPLSFRNDGLDYLLNAVDSDHLKTALDDGDLSDTEDLPKSSWDIEDDDDSIPGDESDEDDEFDDESDDDDDDDNDATESPIVPNLPDSSTVTGILKQSDKSMKKVTDSSKSVQFATKNTNKTKKVSIVAESDSDSEGQGSDSEYSSEDFGPELTPKSETDLADAGVKEDIYGRLHDSSGKVMAASGTYVPPALRSRQLADTTDAKKRLELERLKKQLKGLLNRLSEGTIQGISSQMEELYRGHSRIEVTETLSDLISEACISTILIPERLTMEHAMLVALLHRNVASDVGAYFLQSLVTKLDHVMSSESYGQDKIPDNILILLANLYNFKVVDSLLIFDILKKLTERFGEKDIELILVLLKNVGFSLRKDDAANLKEVIQDVQKRAATVDTTQFTDSSRVNFMLEVLLAIKNNNMRKIPNYDPTHLDHLRKMIRSYTTSSSTEQSLRISLSDLLETGTKGRWWVVGSAWSGHHLHDHTQPGDSSTTPPASEVSGHILELARQQRMNTDIRKNIFCIIMTCEDFVDGFEKLLQLGLKNQQEREIIHVIMDLCLQEKTFNSFYAFLTQKFCHHERRFQMTTQFSMWDRFKELTDYSDQKLINLASYITHLLATKALSLSIFKVIEFGELDKARVRFLKRILHSLLMDQPDHIMKDVFSRIAVLPKLQILREGLKLFMRHFLLRGSKNLDDATRERLETQIGVAEKALTSAEARLLL